MGFLNGNYGFMEDGILFGFLVVLFVKLGGGVILIELKVVGLVMSEEFLGVGCGGGWEVFMNVEWELLYGIVLLFFCSFVVCFFWSFWVWSLNLLNVFWEDIGCCLFGIGYEVLICFLDFFCGFDFVEGFMVLIVIKGWDDGVEVEVDDIFGVDGGVGSGIDFLFK